MNLTYGIEAKIGDNYIDGYLISNNTAEISTEVEEIKNPEYTLSHDVRSFFMPFQEKKLGLFLNPNWLVYLEQKSDENCFFFIKKTKRVKICGKIKDNVFDFISELNYGTLISVVINCNEEEKQVRICFRL